MFPDLSTVPCRALTVQAPLPIPATLGVVSQILQRCIAEEVESVGIIVPAIDAAHPKHAIAGLQERGVQPFHFALPDFDLCIVPEEVASLAQFLHLHNKTLMSICHHFHLHHHSVTAAVINLTLLMIPTPPLDSL